MGIWPEAGGIWGCKINAHRGGWDGSICKEPCAWDCGATLEFRRDNCDFGDGRCFHRETFATDSAGFEIHDSGVGWLMDIDATALDGQVVLLYSLPFEEPAGVTGRAPLRIVGLYVVDRVDELDFGHFKKWRVIPRANSWCQLDKLKVSTPRYERIQNRPYLVHFGAASVRQMSREIEGLAMRIRTSQSSRALAFLNELPDHLRASDSRNVALEQAAEERAVHERAAQEKAERARAAREEAERQQKVKLAATRQGDNASLLAEFEAGLARDHESKPARTRFATVVTRADVSPPQTARVEPTQDDPLPPLFGAEVRAEIAETFDQDVASALWLGGLGNNAMLILRGAPGVGKSRLATRLVDGERTLVVSVGSTWRGREDLLGYSDPVSGQFRPTQVCSFLRTAAAAWDDGDRAPWLIIFEEFNLSSPEHWMSDLLVRSQYGAGERLLRTIPFGGGAPAGWGDDETAVWLSPAVRFAATINSDHTTRALSPRVLDRATLVGLSVSEDALLKRVKVTLVDEQLEAIKALTHVSAARGVRFSMRSAFAIAQGLEQGASVGLSPWAVIDHVLSSQVLSKLRIYAADRTDRELVERLSEEWIANHGSSLPLCASRIEAWVEAVEAGQDILQA